MKTYFRQFGAIGRINASVRQLAKNNIAVGIVSPAWRKHTLSPSYLSVTGHTLSQAGRLTDLNILKIESLLAKAAGETFDRSMGGEKLLQNAVVLEKIEKESYVSSVFKGWKEIGQIKAAVRKLESQGLLIPFFKPFLGSLGLRLCLAHHFSEASEFSYCLRRVLAAHKEAGKEIPKGTLDWLRFIDKFRFLDLTYQKIEENTGEFKVVDITSEFVLPKDNLQAEQIVAAVRDHTALAEDQRGREEVESIFQLLEELGVKEGGVENYDVREIELEVVRIIQRWLPGGAPTLMRFAEVEGKPCLVSEAVALGDMTIKMGEKMLKKKLGEIYNFLPPGSDALRNVSDKFELAAIPNPHVRAFVRGETRLEYIDYEMYKKVCAGFIGKESLSRKEELLMSWVSWPKKRVGERCPILWVPLKREGLKNGQSQKIGLIAVLAKKVSEHDVEKIKNLAAALSTMLHREEISRYTGSYLGTKVHSLLKARDFDKLRSSRIDDATIMFADISGFTALSDVLKDQPDKVVYVLSKLFARLDPIVVKNGGMVDKHDGDCIIADFGVPKREPGDVEAAVNAAIAIQRDVQQVNFLPEMKALYQKYNLQPLGMTIGLNTGTVIAGNLGHEGSKIEFSVIGDAVNQASRLQHAVVRGQILIGERTYDALSPEFRKKIVDGFNAYSRDVEQIRKFILNEYQADGLTLSEDEINQKIKIYLELYRDASEGDIFVPSVIWAKNKGPICCYYVRWDRHAWRYPFLKAAGITLKQKSKFENQPLSISQTEAAIRQEKNEERRKLLSGAFINRLERHAVKLPETRALDEPALAEKIEAAEGEALLELLRWIYDPKEKAWFWKPKSLDEVRTVYQALEKKLRAGVVRTQLLVKIMKEISEAIL